MDVSDFAFELPDELIAQDAAPRGAARLLRLDRVSGTRRHGVIADLPALLRAGDLLVVNNTRVFAARLLGRRVPSGGAVECLLLSSLPAESGKREAGSGEREAGSGEREAGSGKRGAGSWEREALMHPGQKLKPGARVRFEGDAGVLMAEVLERHFRGRRTIRLWSESGADVDTLVDALGHVPLPP